MLLISSRPRTRGVLSAAPRSGTVISIQTPEGVWALVGHPQLFSRPYMFQQVAPRIGRGLRVKI